MEARTDGSSIFSQYITNKLFRVWYADENRTREKELIFIDARGGVLFFINLKHGHVEAISETRLLRMESFETVVPGALSCHTLGHTNAAPKEGGPQKLSDFSPIG